MKINQKNYYARHIILPDRALSVVINPMTGLPSYFALLFWVNSCHFKARSTQARTMSSVALFYEFWWRQKGVDFDQSFINGDWTVTGEQIEAVYDFFDDLSEKKPSNVKADYLFRQIFCIIRFYDYLIKRYSKNTPKSIKDDLEELRQYLLGHYNRQMVVANALLQYGYLEEYEAVQYLINEADFENYFDNNLDAKRVVASHLGL